MAAESGDHADRGRADIGVMTEAFTLVDIAEVHFDHRQFGGVQRIEQGDRGVGIGAGIDDDAGIGLARRLDAIDQRALVIALGELDFYPQAVGLGAASLLDVGERLASVDFGLPLAQHVEVGPVEHQHRLSSRRAPGGLCGQMLPPRILECRAL